MSGKLTLNEQSAPFRKQKCPAVWIGGSLTNLLVQKLLPP